MNIADVRVTKKYIEVKNQVALTPNLQGETGVVFKPETVKTAVADYQALIAKAPYYRVLLDSHVELGKAKWADVGGILNDVWVDGAGAARINYTVFPNTPTYDRLSLMAQMSDIGNVSLSARGFGRQMKIKPAGRYQSDQKVSKIRMLSDSPIKFFQTLSSVKFKKGGVFIDEFVLLGWDLVVAPSQIEASSLLMLSGKKGDAALVRESSGIIRKAFGSQTTIKNHIMTELGVSIDDGGYGPVLEASSGLSLDSSPTVPPLRTYIVGGEEIGDIGSKYGKPIDDILSCRWV